MNDQYQRQVQDQRRMNSEQTQLQAAMGAAMKDQSTAKNPEFLAEFTNVDLDSEVHDWLMAELGPATSSVHALGMRSSSFAFEQRLLVRNLIERVIAEWTPGRQLRQHPKLNYLAQGCRGLKKGQDPREDPEYRAPVDDADRRALRQAAEAITSHQSRSQDGMGADKVSTVQTENRTIQQDETEARGAAARLSGGLFG